MVSIALCVGGFVLGARADFLSLFACLLADCNCLL